MSKRLAKHIRSKDLSKLLLGKDMFTLTLVDFEYETSVSIWKFEMMIVLK
jgi:hypothetical protein